MPHPPATDPSPYDPSGDNTLVGPADVAAAAHRIAGHVRRTPVLRLEPGAMGVEVALAAKLDLLQPTGSFKVRGAMSFLTSGPVPAAGVVAASGGNFGLAVAWAAQRLGIAAEIYVPATSPADKLAAFDGLGAVLHVIDGFYADALTAADRRVDATGALRAHAYDHPAVVAGQGTAAWELLADTGAIDTLLVACGGGGLLAGTIAAVPADVRVVAVETEATPTLHAALAAGTPVDVEVGGIAASSLGARRIGELAWRVRERVARSVLVRDADVREAQRRLWHDVHLVAEPGGAVALAALTSRAYVPDPEERVAVIICGANTDPGSVTTPTAS
jgi:threonine dehydratase